MGFSAQMLHEGLLPQAEGMGPSWQLHPVVFWAVMNRVWWGAQEDQSPGGGEERGDDCRASHGQVRGVVRWLPEACGLEPPRKPPRQLGNAQMEDSA